MGLCLKAKYESWTSGSILLMLTVPCMEDMYVWQIFPFSREVSDLYVKVCSL
jgi:hypothetical protein